MNSEFQTITLDKLRYSLVWEDSTSLTDGLDIQPYDRVLVITSAGCNALNSLLKNPRQVIAVDLNPLQNRLLLFKKHLILHHDYPVFRALLGFDGAVVVAPAFDQVVGGLSVEDRTYWRSFFTDNPGGILPTGKLETYIAGFLPTLDDETQQKLRQLIEFIDVQKQCDFFINELESGPFRTQFIHYFDDANLSKGRDPSLFKYAEESGGQAFYNRLVRQVSTTLVRDNFFFRFFFFGPQHLPDSVLPPCYQPRNYARLRANLDRLTVVNGEAIDYLLSAEGTWVNKASLSNIFEYVSPTEFRRVCRLLHDRPGQPVRFIFWNLLQEQGACLAEDGWADVPPGPNLLPTNTACFYLQPPRTVEIASAINL